MRKISIRKTLFLQLCLYSKRFREIQSGFYKQYGIGLLPRKNQSYSVNLKLKVLKSINKDLISLRDASIKFNISDTGVIVKWKKNFSNCGLAGLQPKTKGTPVSTSFTTF